MGTGLLEMVEDTDGRGLDSCGTQSDSRPLSCFVFVFFLLLLSH